MSRSGWRPGMPYNRIDRLRDEIEVLDRYSYFGPLFPWRLWIMKFELWLRENILKDKACYELVVTKS